MEISNDAFKRLTKFRTDIQKYCDAWKSEITINFYSKIELDIQDTSNDQSEEYQTGTITQISKPVMWIRISIWQDESNEWIIPTPSTPYLNIAFQNFIAHINFYQTAFENILKQNPPSEQDWEIEKKEQIKKQEQNQF